MKYKNKRIEGIIIPSDWDETDLPVEVSIATADTTIKLVADKVTQAELISLIHEQVEVSGLYRDNSEERSIMVVNYRIKSPIPAGNLSAPNSTK